MSTATYTAAGGGGSLNVTITLPTVGPTNYYILNAQKRAQFATQMMGTMSGMMEFAQIPKVSFSVALRILDAPDAPFENPSKTSGGGLTIDSTAYYAYMSTLGFQTTDVGEGLLALDVNLGYTYFGDRGNNC